MSLKEDIHKVAQGIIRAYEGRMASIASLPGQASSQRKATRAFLQEMDSSHKAMAQEMRGGLAQAEANRKGRMATWIGELANARAEAQREWQSLVATLRRKRGVGTGVGEGGGAALDEGGNEVFEFLAEHPDGTRLAQLEKQFGLKRLQVARVLKHLMARGSARKQGLLYFAA